MQRISKEAIDRFKELYPERYAELLKRAEETYYDPPQQTVYVRSRQTAKSIEQFLLETHKQTYFIYTVDMYANEHLYCEEIEDEKPEAVLTRKHAAFIDRNEIITKIKACNCPLCRKVANN